MTTPIDALMSDRRGFLAGIGGLLFAEPKLLLSRLPILYGDGVHDDTEALTALFSGKPIKTATSGDTFRSLYHDGWAGLKGGTYLIEGGVRPTVNFILADARLIVGHNEPVFSHLSPTQVFHFTNCILQPSRKLGEFAWGGVHA